ELAQILGAPVLAESGTTHGRLPFPCTHPLSAPGLPVWAPDIHKRLAEFDVLFAVGLDVFRLYVYYDPPRPLPEKAQLVHLDQDPWQLGKNYPTAVSVIGHPKPSLAELADLLRSSLTADQRDQAARRSRERSEVHRKLREQL